jgi:hypothetical protein
VTKSTKAKIEYMTAYEKRPDVAAKNVARRRAERHAIAAGKAKVGDGVDIDHTTPLGLGGSTSDSNTRALSVKKNRGWRKGESSYKPKKV